MVYAGFSVYCARTFAARPVGARSTVLRSRLVSASTTAAIRDVFPVPAYPLRMKISLLRGVESHVANFSEVFFCPGVGVKLKLA